MTETSKNIADRVKPLVLIAPLDWGLGHTTRCIPLIRQFILLDFEVTIACNSSQKALLQEELKQVSFIHLNGYNLKYGKTRWQTALLLILQAPKILIRINYERKWLRTLLSSKKPSLLISDNRYGFYSRKVKSLFITHQLNIETGLGNLINRFVNWLNYRYIRRFSECWIPDFQSPVNLAGKLSHPTSYPAIPIKYLGAISRLESYSSRADSYHLMILLSGPEPQRTILENIVLRELEDFTGQVILLRGLPGSTESLRCPSHITVFNHLPTQSLNDLICSTEIIISRSGYTTVMDLLKLKKKCILIPTPGQPEQEYLADYLYKHQLAFRIKQSEFSLRTAYQQANQFPYKHFEQSMDQYKKVLADLQVRI